MWKRVKGKMGSCKWCGFYILEKKNRLFCSEECKGLYHRCIRWLRSNGQIEVLLLNGVIPYNSKVRYLKERFRNRMRPTRHIENRKIKAIFALREKGRTYMEISLMLSIDIRDVLRVCRFLP